MTKQLEALIAEMKAAAESATAGQWVRESGEGLDAICSDDDQLNNGFIVAEFQGPEAQANRLFSQSANPANVLALIAALEQAQQQNKELESTLEREREKSRRVMSRNYQLETSPLAVKLPAMPEYPELLPCPVLLEPGFRFGKGVPTSSMLGALKRRAEHQAELDAMSEEERAEYDASIEKLKAVLMPGVAEQRLAAAVELMRQDAPHMLAEESLKDPGGASCGKLPDGWVMVPVKPTPKQWAAAVKAMESGIDKATLAYSAAIAAAPKPELPMKTIIVTLEIDVPDSATDKDISDWVDVEYGQCGGQKLDNPCRGDATEILSHTWKFES